MPGASVALPDLGSVNLPGLKMALIELKGKLSGGKLTIESGKLGNTNDEFFGDIKGELGLTFMNSNGQIVPILNNYDVDLNLKASSAFHSQAKFILDFFLSNCRTDLPEGVQYKCKVKGLSMGMPPQVTSLR